MLGRVVVLSGREALQRQLDELTDVDRRYLAQHPETPSLYGAGVRYRREPLRGPARAREHWQTIPEVLTAGYGDCEDLATWRAAELPGARAVPVRVRSGWHIVVLLPDGSVEDPSRRLGMGGPL